MADRIVAVVQPDPRFPWINGGNPMVLIQNLLSTDYGLMSLIVILIVIYMGWWFSRWFTRKMNEDPQQDSR